MMAGRWRIVGADRQKRQRDEAELGLAEQDGNGGEHAATTI